MKPKTASTIVASIAIALGQPAAEAGGEAPWSFKAGRGITLSAATRAAIGIEVQAVESAVFAPRNDGAPAQVFRVADGSAAASLRIPPSDAEALTEGQTIALTAGQTVFEGEIEVIEPGTHEGAPSEVLLSIPDPAGVLRTGEFLRADPRGPGTLRRTSLAIPASAVVESVRGDFVYAVNGTAFLRTTVALGIRQDAMVEVLDGLFEGDEVVVSGAPHLWMIELQAVNGGKGCADGH